MNKKDAHADVAGDTAVIKSPEAILLTVEEIAHLTGFSVGTLYHWVSQKRIPVVRISPRCIRFLKSAIEQWIEGQVVRPQGVRCERK
jgi:excisionase family DNA binding protein